MTSDVLSDVLRAVRLTGAVYFDFELSAPWVAEAPPSRELAGKVMPGAERIIEYHLIARGTCWGHAVGEEPRLLREGDLIVFPQGDAHVLSSAPGMRAAPDMSRYARPSTPLPIVYELGGGGSRARTRLLRVSRVRRASVQSAARPRCRPSFTCRPRARRANTGWLGTLLNIAMKESGSARAGSENVLARLSEVMFVEAIRLLPGNAAADADRLAGGTARSGRRPGAVGAPFRTPTTVDRRTTGAAGRHVAFGPGRAIHGDGRATADAVSGAVADAARLPTAGRRRSGGGGRRRGRLRI